MSIEEMKAEKKRLLKAIAKEEQTKAILLAAEVWLNDKKNGEE
jgi:hypothetical protein